MAVSWNEIKDRALKFSKEWKGETREHAEAKSFWDAFFHVFGVSRRRIATFEEPVKKMNDQYGFIDLFWKGHLLVEHKSKGRDLDKAYSQALDYFSGLKERDICPNMCLCLILNGSGSMIWMRMRSMNFT